MKLFDKIGREFSGYNILESAKRLKNRKPLQCSLYVTDQCNLDCAYCTEYDNSRPHPSIDDLKKWVRKIRELGTMRIALVGGEPLVHPDIVDLVRYCRELGFATSLTTNGFLLTRKLVAQLEDAGLQVMQISVVRMTPSQIKKKFSKRFCRSPIISGIQKSACTSLASFVPTRCPRRKRCSRLGYREEFRRRFGSCAPTRFGGFFWGRG